MAEASNSEPNLKLALDIHAPSWMSQPGVEAVGLGDDCIKVYFTNKQAVNLSAIPDQVDGIQIIKVVSGDFRALDT